MILKRFTIFAIIAGLLALAAVYGVYESFSRLKEVAEQTRNEVLESRSNRLRGAIQARIDDLQLDLREYSFGSQKAGDDEKFVRKFESRYGEVTGVAIVAAEKTGFTILYKGSRQKRGIEVGAHLPLEKKEWRAAFTKAQVENRILALPLLQESSSKATEFLMLCPIPQQGGAQKWVVSYVDFKRLVRDVIARESPETTGRFDIEINSNERVYFDLSKKVNFGNSPTRYSETILLFADQGLKFRTASLVAETRFVKVIDPKLALFAGGLIVPLLFIVGFLLLRSRAMAHEAAVRYTAILTQRAMHAEELSRQFGTGFLGIDLNARIVHLNPAWLAMTGLDLKEARRVGWQSVVDADELDRVSDVMQRVIIGGVAQTVEFRYRSANGSMRWTRMHVAPTVGVLTSWIRAISTWTDIDTYKTAEAAAEKENELLLSIIRAAPVAMAMFDGSLHYLAYSRKWLEDFGLKADQVTNTQFSESCPKAFQRLVALQQMALVKGEVMSGDEDEFEREGQTGKQFLNWAIHPIGGQQKRGIVMVVHNITELVEAKKEAQQAAQFRSNFLANMSHEIRTPLNGVIGMTEVMLATDMSAEQVDCLHVIRSSGKALMQVIDDILNLSKIEAGKLQLETVEFDLYELIETVQQIFAERIRDKRCELFSHIREKVPKRVSGDQVRVQQILFNLIGNALKFTERGEISVNIDVIEQDESSRKAGQVQLRFEVKDSGIGIPADVLNLLFKPFTQADASTTRKYGGTGLGLSICRQLVGLMGGEIGVTSEVGKGSTFWFQISLGEFSEIKQEPKPLTGHRLLILHPSLSYCDAFRGSMRRLGADCLAAVNASELEKISELKVTFDHVFIDESVHGERGKELFEYFGTNSAFSAARLVLLMPFGRTLNQPLEVDAVFSKPLRLGRLVALIAHGEADQRVNSGTSLEVRPAVNSITLPAATSPCSSTAKKALIVDDNEINRRYAKTLLLREKFICEEAANGVEALEKVQSADYCIVLMDNHMPLMDGLEASRRIRSLGDKYGTLPIIAMTASAMKEDRDRCRDAGMSDFLAKPVLPKDLLAVVKKWTTQTTSATTYESESEESSKPIDVSKIDKAEEPIAASEPIIDAAVWDEWRSFSDAEDFQSFIEITDIFLKNFASNVAEFREAMTIRDREKTTFVAHKLAGSSGAVGANRLAKLFRAYETWAGENQWEKIEKSQSTIEPEYTQFTSQLPSLKKAS